MLPLAREKEVLLWAPPVWDPGVMGLPAVELLLVVPLLVVAASLPQVPVAGPHLRSRRESSP